MHLDHKSEGSGSVLLWIITTALLVFTAARSVHLVQTTLPADSQVLAYAALAGLDGGVLAWLFWTTRSARGATQRTIGTLMIIVDLAGITAAVLGDTMLVADSGSTALVGTVAIWLVPLVIVSNVCATVIAHLVDPDQALRDANRALRDEMERQKADYIRQNAPTLAAQVAEQQARHTAEQEIAKFRGGGPLDVNGDGKFTLADIAAALGVAPKSGNGHTAAATFQAQSPAPAAVVPASQTEPVDVATVTKPPKVKKQKAANVPAEPPRP